MAATKPVYVFVGGVSHIPVFFEKVVQLLAHSGYHAEAVAFPTCGDHTEDTKQWDEVTAIQAAVIKHLDAGLDVVLVLHSYGGWPGSRAVKGLDKETRQKNHQTTGVIEVVFIAAFQFPDNAPMAQYSYLPPWLTVEFAWQKNDFTAETVPNAPWHLSVPKTYIITTKDKTATPDFQFAMLNGVMGESSDSWVIKSINSGHEPLLSQPEKLVEIILQPRLY